MKDTSSDVSTRSLQIAVAGVILIILVVVGSSHYLRLIDKAAMINAESSLSVLEKCQLIYYNIYGRYAKDIDELGMEMPDLKQELEKNRRDSQWLYSMSGENNFCAITATRRNTRWNELSKTLIIREIGPDKRETSVQ